MQIKFLSHLNVNKFRWPPLYHIFWLWIISDFFHRNLSKYRNSTEDIKLDYTTLSIYANGLMYYNSEHSSETNSKLFLKWQIPLVLFNCTYTSSKSVLLNTDEKRWIYAWLSPIIVKWHIPLVFFNCSYILPNHWYTTYVLRMADL